MTEFKKNPPRVIFLGDLATGTLLEKSVPASGNPLLSTLRFKTSVSSREKIVPNVPNDRIEYLPPADWHEGTLGGTYVIFDSATGQRPALDYIFRRFVNKLLFVVTQLEENHILLANLQQRLKSAKDRDLLEQRMVALSVLTKEIRKNMYSWGNDYGGVSGDASAGMQGGMPPPSI